MPWRCSEVWVLTGDKVDTAISIAMSCKLLTEDMNNFIIDNTTEQRLEQRSDGVDGTDCGFEVFLTWGLPIPSEKHIFIQQETSRNTNLNLSCWHGMGCCQMRISNTWKDHWHPTRCLGSWESGADHRRTEGIPIIVQSSRALTLRRDSNDSPVPTILQDPNWSTPWKMMKAALCSFTRDSDAGWMGQVPCFPSNINYKH